MTAINLEDDFPEESVRNTVPYWRLHDLLDQFPLSKAEGKIVISNQLTIVDLSSRERTNKKIAILGELVQTKCN